MLYAGSYKLTVQILRIYPAHIMDNVQVKTYSTKNRNELVHSNMWAIQSMSIKVQISVGNGNTGYTGWPRRVRRAEGVVLGLQVRSDPGAPLRVPHSPDGAPRLGCQTYTANSDVTPFLCSRAQLPLEQTSRASRDCSPTRYAHHIVAP